MNTKPVVSSYHYDAYNNLLCLVSGQKTFEFIPPESFVKSHSILSETCNNLIQKKGSFAYKIRIKRGQSLFIPEGWWHRVISDFNTVAVNFWWSGIDQGTLVSNLSSSLDFYLARNSLRRLAVSYASKKLLKKLNRKSIPEDLLVNIKKGDTELVYELLQNYPTLELLYVKTI